MSPSGDAEGIFTVIAPKDRPKQPDTSIRYVSKVSTNIVVLFNELWQKIYALMHTKSS